MSKYRKRERHKIYKNALRKFQKGETCLTSAIWRGAGICFTEQLNLPEFILFRHRTKKMISWWGGKKVESRLYALLFCIEMTK